MDAWNVNKLDDSSTFSRNFEESVLGFINHDGRDSWRECCREKRIN